MKLRKGKVGKSTLIAFALICVIFFIIETGSIRKTKTRYYSEKIAAAKTCAKAFEFIKVCRESLNLPIDEINDPNQTGLVGYQYSLITSGRSDLISKLTSTNPNFAALFVELLTQVGVKKGDLIAIGWNGSYPALNIALLSAAKVLAVEPIIITSVTASMWGANDPHFTWLDMENCLGRATDSVAKLPYRSIAAALGGEDDNGLGLSPAGRILLDSAIERNNIPKLTGSSLGERIEQRFSLYWQKRGLKRIVAFVNIGNCVTNIGDLLAKTKTGIITRPNNEVVEPSVIAKMLANKVPVINILDVNRLAEKYSLPIAPSPLPKIGTGRLFSLPRYSVYLALVMIGIILVILFLVIRYDLEFYLLSKAQQQEILKLEGK